MRLVQGVGVNDANYNVIVQEIIGYVDGKPKRKLVWRCPLHLTWAHVLERCYNKKWKEKYPAYKDCTVCEEWLLFSTFKSWMETQDWEGKHLDKDILFQDNKLYSPETCVFVTRQVNNFLIDRRGDRGKYKIGCSWDKRSSVYRSFCNNPLTAKQEHLGGFDTEQGAHEAWLAKKLEHAHTL